ncbi:hypothetical protein [uncultured Alistipes sp.]|jgi:hypothetical protein|uniref:hypothetical protein n=1 Tax=uncultured Alistipes sp. TaxID=538949 RepID=UPI0025E97D05|nr:hypothetical protein [uncultured Alistipes sp.]
MKKFKIIEDSRFLDKSDMEQTIGGCVCFSAKHTTCDGDNYQTGECMTYTICGAWSTYESCSVLGGRTTCTGVYTLEPIIINDRPML